MTWPTYRCTTWLVDLMANEPVLTQWNNTERERHYLKHGLLWPTKEQALAHHSMLLQQSASLRESGQLAKVSQTSPTETKSPA